MPSTVTQMPLALPNRLSATDRSSRKAPQFQTDPIICPNVVKERVNLRLNADFFNVLNHPGNPKQLRRKHRNEAKGRLGAVAHRITKVVRLLLHEGVEYQEKGVAPANPRPLVRKFRRLTKELARAGLDAKSLSDQAAPATP